MIIPHKPRPVRASIAVTASILVISLLSPPSVSAQSLAPQSGSNSFERSSGSSVIPPASTGLSGSSEALTTALTSGLNLLTGSSLLNPDAQSLAQQRAGSLAPLSAAGSAAPGAQIVTPAMILASTLLSLLPVGSLTSGNQIINTFLGPAPLGSLIGLFTGNGYRVPGPDGNDEPPRVISRRPETNPNVPGRLEIWTVRSQAMQREVDVEVFFPPAGGEDAPMLYYFEGVDTPKVTGLRVFTPGPRLSQEHNFSLISPTGGPGSNFADWDKDDPYLGRNKWVTFVTQELGPLLEAEKDLKFNGKRGTLGLSMGAGAALQMAAAAPKDHFVTTGGISGCYSAKDDLGYETLRLNVSTRGGKIENMWGPRSSPKWAEHHLPDHPEKFNGMHVFMSAATGALGVNDVKNYGNDPMLLLSGSILEAGSMECTNAMDRSLKRAGISHETLRLPTGIHNGTAFGPGFDAAMKSMLPVLTKNR